MNSFSFKDLYEVKVNKISPVDKSNNLTFILLPAIGVPIKKYERLIIGLKNNGYSVVYADYPCCGDNFPQISKSHDYDYSDLLKYFIPNLIKSCDTQNLVLLGHSLGGHLASLYALENNIPIVIVASGNIHYKNWNFVGRAKILSAVILFKSLTKAYGFFPGYKVGFGHREAKSLMNNWCHTVLTGNYDFSGIEIKRSNAKSLFINIKNDNFSPLESTKKLAEMFSSTVFQQIELPSHLKGNRHSIWLKSPDQIIKIIDNTMKKSPI